MSKDSITFFRSQLLEWYNPADRPLPWKDISDPYLIWLSEIILQQTRAAQAIPYFNKISEKFPSVKALAEASIDELLAMWQGLGYYSRARNLHYSAQLIMDKHEGVFPSNYEDVLALKGVGKYTAAAITSFAFGQAYPVVDGNVIRIISRYFDMDIPVDTKPGIAHINKLVEEVFDPRHPALFNQAIMDFGATVCLPKKPSCGTCPFSSFCLANANQAQLIRPIKSKKIKRKIRYFSFLFLSNEEQIFIQKRTDKDIWQGLYQLPLIEGQAFNKKSALSKELKKRWPFINSVEAKHTYKQLLTHQVIHSIVWEVNVAHNTLPTLGEGIWVSKKELTNFGFPKSLTLFLRDIFLL